MPNDKPKISFAFCAILFCIAFGLNFIWEISQTFAFKMGGVSTAKMLLFCALASIIDAVVTMLIFWLLQKVLKRFDWKFYLAAAVFGAVCAILFEKMAFTFNLWTYDEEMIVLPLLGTGLLPFLQLMILVPVAIWIIMKLKWRKL